MCVPPRLPVDLNYAGLNGLLESRHRGFFGYQFGEGFQ
jgi:hypothetical protein